MKLFTVILSLLMTIGSQVNSNEQFNLDEWTFLSCQQRRDVGSDELRDWSFDNNFLVRKDHTQIYAFFLEHNNCKLVDRNKRLNCRNSEYNRKLEINRFTG
jgi:hypothetical protein